MLKEKKTFFLAGGGMGREGRRGASVSDFFL